MKPNLTKQLFDSMNKKLPFLVDDKFFEILTTICISGSSRFSEQLPLYEQCEGGQHSDSYSVFSLRRILRNGNANHNSIMRHLTFYANRIGSYSSSALTRRIRNDSNIVSLMVESSKIGNPFSLLGKLENYDYSNNDQILFRETKPILIIPEFEDHAAITYWETAHLYHEKEIGMYFRRFKKIKVDYAPV